MNKKRLLTVMGGKSKLVYLLRDLFLTDDDAPLTSPRTCEPNSEGTLVITDVANKLSISGENIEKTAGAWKIISGSTFSRRNGLAMSARIKQTTFGSSANCVFGTSEDGINYVDAFKYYYGYYGNAVISDGVTFTLAGQNPTGINEYVEILIVHRSSGAFILARGGHFGKWNLIYPGSSSDGANIYLLSSNGSSADTGYIDNLKVLNLGTIFTTDFGLANYHVAVPTSGVSYTGSRNSLYEITWTAATDEILDIDIRKTDDNNKIILRCNQTASTIAHIRKDAGIETVIQSVAQTWTNGTSYKIVGWVGNGNAFRAAVDAVIKLQSGSVNHRYGKIFGASGFTTATNFAVYNLDINSLPEPYDFTGWKWNLGVGDSKIRDNTTSAYLSELLKTSTGNNWCYETSAESGITVVGYAAAITNLLELLVETPENIYINLGTNDLASLPAEATWKAGYSTIITTLHTRFPTSKIYLFKPVRLQAAPPSTPHGDTATMHGYIDDLVALYDYVYAGVDETDLEGGDSYVTYFADSLHPNYAGYYKTAELMKAILYP